MEKKPATTPLWLKAAIAVFLVFAIFRYLEQDAVTTDEGTVLKTSINDNLTDVTRKVFPGLIQLTKTQDVTVGNGTKAYCGGTATIAYKTWLLKTNTEGKVQEVASEPVDANELLAFDLGAHRVMPALEEGVEGMRVGGVRKIMAPARLAYDVKGFTQPGVPPGAEVAFEVTLKDVTPVLQDNGLGLRTLDITQPGYDPVRCGDEVAALVTVWTAGGRKLLAADEKKPVIFTPGKGRVFAGLEQGVLGMIQNGQRTLIVPPAWQVALAESADAPLFETQEEAVIVDILLLERKRYQPEVLYHDDGAAR